MLFELIFAYNNMIRECDEFSQIIICLCIMVRYASNVYGWYKVFLKVSYAHQGPSLIKNTVKQ